MYEAWHYREKLCYSKTTKSEGLFADFVFNFYKFKQQASGFPRENMDPTEIEEYCQEFFNHTGVQLDKDAIEFSPVARSTCKIILNSLWVSIYNINTR
jgi:hypothetical protein